MLGCVSKALTTLFKTLLHQDWSCLSPASIKHNCFSAKKKSLIKIPDATPGSAQHQIDIGRSRLLHLMMLDPSSEWEFHHLLPINSNKTGVFSCETLSNMDAGALLGQPNEKKDPCASRPEQRRQRIWRSSWEIEDSQRISMLRERGWLPPLTDTFSWEKAATWILPYIKNFPPGEITNATSKGNKRQTAVL